MNVYIKLFFVLALMLMGRGQVRAEAAEAHGKSLHMQLSSSPPTLDWTGQVDPAIAPIIVNICEGLFTFRYPGEKLVPGIAESLTRSKDLKEYTFKLKRSAKWSDGRQVYAQDFVDAWFRTISPQTTSLYPYYLFDIVNAREFNEGKIPFSKVGVKAVDDLTLIVTFNHPVKDWELTTTFWPLFPIRKDLVEKFGNNWWRAGVMASTGPFQIVSYEPGLKMTLKRNPYYPKSNSNVEEIIIDFIENHETAFLKYEAKELLMLNALPFSGIKALTKRADFKMGPIFKEHMLSMNVDRFPTNNRDFRLAVIQAIDPTQVIPKEALQLRLARSLVPPPLPGSQAEPFIKFDPVSAREHLKKSGVLVDKSFQLVLLTSTEEPFGSTSTNLKNQIEKNLGVNVKLLMYSNVDLVAYKALRDFNIIDHPQTIKVWTSKDLLKPYTSDSLTNERHYSNPIYDQWVELEKYKEAQETLISTEGISLPLYYELSAYLMSPHLKGVYLNGMGFFILKDAIVD